MADESIRTTVLADVDNNVTLAALPTEARDLAMGRYMDAFSSLEGMVHLATALIMQIDIPVMGDVFAVMMTKQSIDLLEAVGQTHLTTEGAERVHVICERLVRRNMRRNHIVHGAWSHAVLVSDTHVTEEWVRWYQHAKPEMRKLPHTDPKVAGMFTFTVPELDKATGHVEEMTAVVSALIGDLPSLRPPPQPAEESPAT